MHKLKGKSGFLLTVGVGVLVGLASAMVMLVFANTPPPYFIVVDQNGPNDESGQGDLTKMGRYDDPGDPLDPTDDALDIFWSWDDTGFSGQSGDACAQFGVPGPNPDKVAFVICGQVHGAGSAADPVKFSTIYARNCNSGGTNSGDRCVNPSTPNPLPGAGDILAGDILNIDPNAVLITGDDPFPAGDGYPGDSTLRLRIKKSFLPTNARLLNVCAFESTGGGGNNNPNDCIANEGGGFLIIKKTVNADIGAEFDFNVTGLPAGQSNPYSVAGGGQISIGLPIGNHDVTEVDIPAGWQLASASCVTEGGQSTGNVNLPTVSAINVTAGLFTTCTFTNNAKPGKLTLVKSLINDNNGGKSVSDFTPLIDGVPAVWGANEIPLGSHTISEASATGYTMVSISGACASNGAITIAPGDDKTCTITNDDNRPSLTLTKNVTNNNGGTASASDFTLTATGPTTISGAGGASSGSGFGAGVYTLSETSLTGYTAGQWSCTKNGGNAVSGSSVSVALGDTVSCIVTNDDEPGTLIVKKVVINDNGGTKTASDFSFKVGNGAPVAFGANGEKSLTLNAGSYTVTEVAAVGYNSDDSNCANVVVKNGLTTICTITNNDVAPGLTLVKQVVNDNGGTAEAGDWTLTADGGAAGILTGTTGVTSDSSFNGGTYHLSESGGPSGYSASTWSCVVNFGAPVSGNTIVLGAGDNATCTITNNDVAPKLTLVKNVVKNNGGTAVAANWTLTADGGPLGSLSGAGGAVSGSTFKAGNYSLSESTGPAGYTASDFSCVKNGGGAVAGNSVSLTVGDIATCTITNDDVAPQLTLIKYVDNSTSNDALKDASDFLLSAVGTSASISGAGGVTSGPTFSAGTYTLSESNTLGYVGSPWSCSGGIQFGNSITLGVGQSATCSVLNSAVNISPVIKVDKTATPANLPQSGGTVTFTVKVSNNSGGYDPFLLGTLTDDVYGDLTVLVEAGFKDQQSTTCSLPQLIPGGSSYTCSFTANFAPIPNNTSFSEHDVVMASGTDDDNSGVSSFATASDDAFVTMSPPIAVTRGTCSIYEFDRIFTPDIQNIPYYKLHATNPGQFFYNVSAFGDEGDEVKVTLTLPWPFVTQGNMPVHLYDSVLVVDPVTGQPYDGSSEDFCYVLGNDLGPVNSYVVTAANPLPPNTVQYGAITPGGTNYSLVAGKWVPKSVDVVLNVKIPASGMVFIRQHIDDGLKGPLVDVTGDGVRDSLFYGKGTGDNATNALTGAILIPENTEHPFSVTFDPMGDNLPGSVSIYNDNVFKKNTGVAGRITDENGDGVEGKQVNLYAGSSASGPVIGSGISDEAGWYIITYKHTGKAAQYTVQLVPAGAAVTSPNPVEITLKSNGFAEVLFEVDLP